MGSSAETRGEKDKIFASFLSVLDKKHAPNAVFAVQAVLYCGASIQKRIRETANNR
jgi:hypothetical protein